MTSEYVRAGLCLVGADSVTDAEMRRQYWELFPILERLVVGYEGHAAMCALLACVTERLKERDYPLEHGVVLLTAAMEKDDAPDRAELRVQ